MKRIIVLALAVLMLLGALTGCSAGGYAYSDTPNVSTTRDGTVNGTNHRTTKDSTTYGTYGRVDATMR